MGLFSAITGIFGGGAQKKSAQKATDAMVAAYNRGIDTQNEFNQQVRQDYAPYTAAGGNAVRSLDELMRAAMGGGVGTPPIHPTDEMLEAQSELEARLKGMPLYQSLYNNGREALLQTAAATGGLRGGNTQRGLADFGADTLARVYDDTYAKLSGVAGLGLGAQGAVTQVGGNTANNVTNLQSEIGGAQANNFLARGRINAQNWSNIGSFLDDAVAGALAGFGGMPRSLAGAGGAASFGAPPAAPTGNGGFSLLKALGAIF